MNKLLQGMQQQPNALTQNGDLAHATTWNACLDLFGNVGSLRKDPQRAVKLFTDAYAEDKDLAVRIALWSRDARGGAGERGVFREIFRQLSNGNAEQVEVAKAIVPKIPELGRWDDLLVALDTPVQSEVTEYIAAALLDGNGLCAKWMPRKTEKAAKLRAAWGMSPKQYRKLLVSLTNVVETKMCAKQWDQIDFGKLPSLASARYQKAFTRNAEASYEKYVEALVKGEAKINAGAVFPHDVVQSALQGRDDVATQQWKALPNYMEGTDAKVIAMVDVSGSMSCGIGTKNGRGDSYSSAGVTCMQVAVALGLYCAERNAGPFKDNFITFTTTPRLHYSNPALNLRNRYISATQCVGYDTNFDAAYRLILSTAVAHKVPQEDMPDMILVLSDMQFNASAYHFNGTAQTRLKKAFADAGYKMPKMVYWNLNASYGNSPITKHDDNCALVSGFSPAIMTAVLGAQQFDPCSVMIEAVMSDRYKWQ